MDKQKIRDEMLEAIFIKTGGRDENPLIADICAEIAINHSKPKTPRLLASGIQVREIRFNELRIGDMVWDVDMGLYKWNGIGWEYVMDS